MPDDQTPSPAAEASPAPAPAASASQPASVGLMQEWRSAFADDALAEETPADVSNGTTDPPATAAAASAPDAEARPGDTPEGVSASDAPAPGSEPESPATEQQQAQPDKPLSRREQERLERDQRIADLEAKTREYESPEYRQKLRDEILAEQAQQATSEQEVASARADAERFERLNRTPDAELSAEDYQWREDRKELIRRYPEAVKSIQADAERYIQERIAQADRTVKDGWSGIQADIVAQIQASEGLPNVDKAAFKQPGVTWQQMAEQIHAAGAAWKEGQLTEQVTKAEARATAAETEAARVAKENDDLRAEIGRGIRTPANLGRTAGAAPGADVFDPSIGWRGNLGGAFATNGTG